MRKIWPALAIITAFAAGSVDAQEVAQGGAKAAAAEVAVGTAVADRQLTGMAESFPADTEKLYCYMKITNAADMEVQHVWYKGDTEMSRVTLKVGGSPWRTWSSKTLGAGAAGDWRCDVVQDGTVLQSVKFKVE